MRLCCSSLRIKMSAMIANVYTTNDEDNDEKTNKMDLKTMELIKNDGIKVERLLSKPLENMGRISGLPQASVCFD